MERAQALDWRILEQPDQLRITTIDAFCRGLALQSPLSWGDVLAGLGGKLEMAAAPEELYRRAATRTIELLKAEDSPARRAVEALMLWRDNHWKDVESLIVPMLAGRNRWYQEFVFAREVDWEALRHWLEAPFRRAARQRLDGICGLLSRLPGSGDFALEIARGACVDAGKSSPMRLAERAELPWDFAVAEDVFEGRMAEALMLEDAIEAYGDLASFLMTEGRWRKVGGLNKNFGFPASPEGKAAKGRFGALVDGLDQEPGLREALAAFLSPLPVRYTDAEWGLIQDLLAVLRFAAGQLQVVFAETGSVDFTEVAQIALRVLAPENGFPSDFAIRQADGIRHLLIDEFQDTSRSQHELLSRLIAAWPEREGRSCFCVGDPMQSIYGFREAEVELFERTRRRGIEVFSGIDPSPLQLEFVPLRANFRTTPSLVEDLNRRFEQIFAEDDGSGVRFFPAEAARETESAEKAELHLSFAPAGKVDDAAFAVDDAETVRQTQLGELAELVREKLEAGVKTGAATWRVAVLARTKKSLIRIAETLREAGIGYRAIELVPLDKRPEVLDALMVVRALLNPADRTAWLGVLRAPWCGLALEELHLVTSADDVAVHAQAVPALLGSRLPALFAEGRMGARAFAAASRVERVMRNAAERRASAGTAALGTWLESVWKALGGGDTVNAEQRGNLRLLWATLDGLPQGEIDLAGPALQAALGKLCALPDPAASAEFGVQLMTIHQSKGLEFEVVIVPDLEAESRKSERTMISWLERGLAGPDETGQDEAGQDQDGSDENAGPLTEFLIAPIPPKGAEAGATKKWVDRVKRERERQELRRLLYVAATRAREELHLFARPRFRVSAKTGEAALASATGLLATAWPAIGEEVEARFAAWIRQVGQSGRAGQAAAGENWPDAGVAALAAAADANLGLVGIAGGGRKPTMLRRLPEGYAASERLRLGGLPGPSIGGSDGAQALYMRREGGLESRLLGVAVHALLEQLSRLRRGLEPAEAAAALGASLPAAAAKIRSAGVPQGAAALLAGEALEIVQRAAAHPFGAWISAAHPEAESEARWTGVMRAKQDAGGGGPLWNLRPDRVFFATAADAVDGSKPSWWIIDYKTSEAGGADLGDALERERFLSAHREVHQGQLGAYARALRGLRETPGEPALRVRAGIFYPRLLLLDTWEI
jgi:superfamily I DNA/RNA helicase